MRIVDRSDFVPKPGGGAAVQVDEQRDFTRFARPMAPVPDRVAAAVDAGVRSETAAYLADPNLLLDVGGAGSGRGDGLTDAVLRQPDSSMVVACLTEMPGVKAHMWDWWFAWHSFASRRYRLWHPEDHIATAIAEDRRHEPRIRDRWVGNTSYVDEMIGAEYSRLAISFVTPESVGLDATRVDEIGLAICARVSLRRERLAAGHLIHLVEDTADGCRMHSRFHLGDGESHVPGIGRVINKVVNTGRMRRKLLPDVAGTALLHHCSNEMSHLAAILPDLYSDFGDE